MNINKTITEYLNDHDIINVLIAGSTCSGKTTLANRIKDYFSNVFTVSIIAEDDYFKDLEDIPKKDKGFLTDSIDAFWTEELKEDVKTLFRDKEVMMPRYLVSTNKRIDKSKKVSLSQINIFEGLHIISIFNGMSNSIKIYIDTDLTVCLQRRIRRDKEKYDVPEWAVRRHFEDNIIPMYFKFIDPQKKVADIILT